jgi:plastocyanin
LESSGFISPKILRATIPASFRIDMMNHLRNHKKLPMKFFSTLLLSLFLLTSAHATIYLVAVTNNQFTPANLNVVVGDTIQFNFQAGFHNVLSSTNGSATGVVPAGAADINSGGPSGTNPRSYQYKVTVLGDYRYYCQVHSTNGITGMVGFFTASAPLPASLKDFDARFANNAVQVSWQTVNEVNVSHFTINKSYNGKEFMEVTTLPAIGNGASLQSYSFSDGKLNNGSSYLYYSLTTVDKDGKKSLSPIVQVRNPTAVKKLITSLSPNPVSKPGHLMLQFNSDKAGMLKVVVYNAAGKKVLQDEMTAVTGLNNGHLHMGDMVPGAYTIVFSLGKMKENYTVIVE